MSTKAIVGTFDTEQMSAPDRLFVIVHEHVDKQITTELLTACIEVLERNGYAGNVDRTLGGGVLLSGRKEGGDDRVAPA